MSDPAPRRRRWWLVFPLLATLVAADVAFEVNVPQRVEVTLETPKLPAGQSLKVLHLSDLHGKTFSDGNVALFRLMEEARPDLVVITGDLIDHETQDLAPVQRFVDHLSRLYSPAVFYVSGNHEWWNPQRPALIESLKGLGVTVLNNSHTLFTKGALTINLCGVDDAYTGHDRLSEAIDGVDAQRLTLLISHSPAPARKLSGTPVDLMLAGHTHGGQVRLPVVGAVIVPGEGWFPKFDKGRFALPEGRQLYIDSGLGTSMTPLRFLNRSQFSLVTIAGR